MSNHHCSFTSIRFRYIFTDKLLQLADELIFILDNFLPEIERDLLWAFHYAAMLEFVRD